MTACLKEPIYLSGKVSSPKMSIIKFKCRHIKPTWRDIGIYLESWLCLRHTAQYNLETLKGKSGSFWASSIHCLMWNRFGLKGIYHSFKCLITVTIFLDRKEGNSSTYIQETQEIQDLVQCWHVNSLPLYAIFNSQYTVTVTITFQVLLTPHNTLQALLLSVTN